jgi:hypothetical protein
LLSVAGVSVIVGASRESKTQIARKRNIAGRLVAIVFGVICLERVESGSRIGGNPVVVIQQPRVSQRGEASRRMNRADRLLRRRPLARDERRPAVREPTFKRLARIGDTAGRHKSPRD